MTYVRLLVFLFLLPVMAQAADWRFYGSTDVSKDVSKEDWIDQFYDAESVQRLSDKTVRVWTSAFPRKDINHVIKKLSKGNEKLIKAIAEKQFSGYRPDICLLSKVIKAISEKELEDLRNYVLCAEVIANLGVVNKKIQIFYEIDCSGKRGGELSISLFNPDGIMYDTSNYDAPQFKYIPPDSSVESLMEMVCKKQ